MKRKNNKLGHYCGIAGIFARDEINIPEHLFYALFSLQHRGQESCGISYRKGDQLVVYKDLGMVAPVLSRYLQENRLSNVGIGHVRYSTHGGNKVENVQPIMVSCNKGTIALAHNGNLSNTRELKQKLFSDGSIFQSTSDSEVILHLISRSRKTDFYGALKETLGQMEGAFSLAMVHDNSLVLTRDPLGFRPLYIGSRDGVTYAASETCALDTLGVKEYRSVDAGELTIIDKNGVHTERFAPKGPKKQCIFELIYFARPDSSVFDTSVHLTRKRMGAALAACETVSADIVVPVPDSGNIAALGCAEASGLPFEMGLQRNHYAGRSFIMPTTAERELAVRMKLHPVKTAVMDKRIILIDDSIVRGTTSRTLVKLLKDAGAKEVHLRLSSPEIKWPCYFGIDTPTRDELISNRKNPEELAAHIGADSVKFLPIDKLASCVENPEDFCYACFSGSYPVDVSQINNNGACL
ncbi:MAG: amidophosphoribosyltransferase [Spirochaetales bacterium]|nr:MAG: amidophosphoribosyltransferase [Spirochaetales bacterium]